MKAFNELTTKKELAAFLNITPARLYHTLYSRPQENLYTSFNIQKKNGAPRTIHAPNADLKKIQNRIAQGLYKHYQNVWGDKENRISHAFEKNKNIITNAKFHQNKKYVLNIDLKDFFESFHFGRVRGYFMNNRDLMLSSEVSTAIAQLTCYNKKLPQGAPSSPIITNLICGILDHRISKIAKKYNLVYTRYADDLTFSTNDKHFITLSDKFLSSVTKEVNRSGFIINEKKTRLQYKDSRQVVTGIVVNKKISVNRTYIKETRAMAHNYFKTGSYTIDNLVLNKVYKLEGRFTFINQIDSYNIKKELKEEYVDENIVTDKFLKRTHEHLSSTEKQYKQFLFFKYFYHSSKPLVVVEGKTDVIYLKAALKNLYEEYPNLVTRDTDGTFNFKISFLKKTEKLKYFLKIEDNNTGLINIYNHFIPFNDNIYPNYFNFFNKISEIKNRNPIFLLFDNDMDFNSFVDNRAKFKGNKKTYLYKNLMVNAIDHLYILTIPKINESKTEIEHLFDEKTLSHEIGGKQFNIANDKDSESYYGKHIFSDYIRENYLTIDFSQFRPVLDNLDKTISEKDVIPENEFIHN